MAEAARAEAMPRGSGRAVWRWPRCALGAARFRKGLLRSGRRAHQLRRAILSRSEWNCGRRIHGWWSDFAPAGAVITGKTHLHPLAYGITGENPEFGDCLQPGDRGALTGGSSSGAAASVLEGSAVAAIGTDTGGSVRAPAASVRAGWVSRVVGRGDWRGGAHLAQSFDTMGWLFRDLEDAPLLARSSRRQSRRGRTRPSRASP